MAAAFPSGFTVLVSDSVTAKIRNFIERYGPDSIYTLGLSYESNNSRRITASQARKLFYADDSSVYIDSYEKAPYAIPLAKKLNIPVSFRRDENSIDFSSKSIEEIKEEYLKNSDDIRYIVASDSEDLFAASLFAAEKGAYLIETTPENALRDIRNAANLLSSKGMYFSSDSYKLGSPPNLVLIGDLTSGINPAMIGDPGLEILDNSDGDTILTDFIYSDIDDDGFADLSVGRLDPDYLSMALAEQKIEKADNATFIGQYRHGNLIDLYMGDGGMAQAEAADFFMDIAGFSTRRIIEQREPEIDGDLVSDLKNLAIALLAGKELIPKVSFAGAVLIIGDLGTKSMHYIYELDWTDWASHPEDYPKHLEALNEDTDIGNPKVLGFFGLGDESWLVPELASDVIDIVLFPYAEHGDISPENISGLLYNDFDSSCYSRTTLDAISNGGSVICSSGIVHDPYSGHFSNRFFYNLASGLSAGGALREAYNSDVMEEAATAAYLMLHNNPSNRNLNIKTKYEKIFFGDPGYSVAGEKDIPKVMFYIKQFRSFRATSEILPSESDALPDDIITLNGTGVPVFVREFDISGALKDVSFEGLYDSYESESFYLEDEHYADYSQCPNAESCGLPVDYPEKEFWFAESNLMDGRKRITVYVPYILEDRILSEGVVHVDYESDPEVIIYANNAAQGDDAEIVLDVFSSEPREFRIYIDGNLHDTEIFPNGTYEVYAPAEEIGAHELCVVGDSVVRCSYFRIEEEEPFEIAAPNISAKIHETLNLEALFSGDGSFSIGLPKGVELEMLEEKTKAPKNGIVVWKLYGYETGSFIANITDEEGNSFPVYIEISEGSRILNAITGLFSLAGFSKSSREIFEYEKSFEGFYARRVKDMTEIEVSGNFTCLSSEMRFDSVFVKSDSCSEFERTVLICNEGVMSIENRAGSKTINTKGDINLIYEKMSFYTRLLESETEKIIKRVS